LFLYLEKKEMPLHIGSVFILDGPASVDDLRQLIDSKLPLIPRYRQRVVFPPVHAGYPVWEFDPEFDINNHIHSAHLARPTLAALERFAGHLFSEIMDRSRPLWDLTLVDGLAEGRSALVARVHHCLVDGVAGIGLMSQVLDSTPDPRPLPHHAPFHPPEPSAAWATLSDSMISSFFHTMERVMSFEAAALNVVGKLSQDLLNGSSAPIPPAQELLPPAQHFPFFAPALGPRKVSWATFPMDQIHAIRQRHDVKVNDVGMMILAGAMRRYAKLHHQGVKHRLLRLMVPVDLRNGDKKSGLGNKISLLPINVPLDIADPAELLCAVHNRAEAVKHSHASDLMILAGSLLATLPVPVQAQLVGTISNNVPVLPFDMVCTNVRGPDQALYLLGRKILTYYPYVPIGDFMGVCCAMASYDGTFYFSLTGDCASAPDLDRLRDFLDETFAELREASGLRQASAKPTTAEPETVAEPLAMPAAKAQINGAILEPLAK